MKNRNIKLKNKNKKSKNRNMIIRFAATALAVVLLFTVGTGAVFAEEDIVQNADLQEEAAFENTEGAEDAFAEDDLAAFDTQSGTGDENMMPMGDMQIGADFSDSYPRDHSGEEDPMMIEQANASVSMIKDFCSIRIGESKKLEYELVNPGTLSWHTTNSDVCSVSSDGTVTGREKGFAIIWAKHSDGTYDYCKMYVGYYIGADISSYQTGADWDMIKASGIDFVILRAGYGNDASTQTDKVFEQYYNEAQRVGIPVGAYWFNYTEGLEDAKKEAEAFWSVVGGKDLKLGYWADYEQDSYNYYYRVFGKYPDSALMTGMVTNFLSDVKDRAGEYAPVGYYSSLSPLKDWFGPALRDNWPLWAAYYVVRTDDWWEDGYSGAGWGSCTTLLNYVSIPERFLPYTQNLTMLQFTCSEHCRKIGLSSGGLDMNIIPMDSPMALRMVTAKADSAMSDHNKIVVSWTKPENAESVDGYAVLRKKAGEDWQEIGTVQTEYIYDNDGSITGEETQYSFDDTTAQDFEEYYYTVRAYAVSGSEKIYSQCDEDGVYCLAVLGGDVNRDGQIDIMDYVMIRNHVDGTAVITDEASLSMADINGDSIINAGDYLALKQYIMERN